MKDGERTYENFWEDPLVSRVLDGDMEGVRAILATNPPQDPSIYAPLLALLHTTQEQEELAGILGEYGIHVTTTADVMGEAAPFCTETSK